MITIVFPKCFTLNPSTANFPSMNHNSEAEKCRLLTFTSAYYRQTVKNICGSMIHIWNFLFKLAPKLKIYFVKHVPTQLYFPRPLYFLPFSLSLFCWFVGIFVAVTFFFLIVICGEGGTKTVLLNLFCRHPNTSMKLYFLKCYWFLEILHIQTVHKQFPGTGTGCR